MDLNKAVETTHTKEVEEKQQRYNEAVYIMNMIIKENIENYEEVRIYERDISNLQERISQNKVKINDLQNAIDLMISEDMHNNIQVIAKTGIVL